MNIGAVIRNLRKDAGLTLAELSQKSNVALATLSRIETGKMTGTLESHMQIAKALGLTLPQFYSEVDKLKANQTEPEQEYRANMFVHNKDASSTILTKDIFNKKMLPVLIELKRGGKTHKEELKLGAEKFIYVLSGKIEIIIGTNKEILEKGTTLYFDASQPHYIKNIGKGDAMCLCVVTPVAL
ncbi:MAG: XRE family transcriptional regulator [Candidatus Omnitrophica bacterium]|jgi:transcriptional regulator with XRE-family HTH domain|nr:XRE family transcriptional regulator [Candidatus Omnitrophota bacterium]